MLARSTCMVISVVALVSVGACSSVREMDVSGIPQVTIDDPSDASAIGRAIEERGEVVVCLREGDALPVETRLELPVARLEAGQNVVRFTRDVWLYLSREAARISPDGRRWAEFGDLAGLQDLFGIEGGVIHVGFRATKAEGALLTVSLDAH